MDRNGRLAVLLAAVWAGFVGAAFWGLAVAPRLVAVEAADEARFVRASEDWWQARRNGAGEPALVLLSDADCDCATGSAQRRLADSAHRLGVQVLAVDRQTSAGLPWPQPMSSATRVDALVFDALGRLQLAFLSSNPDHCVAAEARLRAGLAGGASSKVWPGICSCA